MRVACRPASAGAPGSKQVEPIFMFIDDAFCAKNAPKNNEHFRESNLMSNKYPSAEPGALLSEPLKAARSFPDLTLLLLSLLTKYLSQVWLKHFVNRLFPPLRNEDDVMLTPLYQVD